MIRVAYVTKNLAANGITNVVMNYGIHLDQSRFELTVFSGAPVEHIYANRLKEENIRVIELAEKRANPVAYYTALWKELRKGFDIVHIHGNSATITIELLVSMLAGVRIRIAHGHNVTCDHRILHRVLQPVMKRGYSHGFACSDAAGKWLFGNGSYEVLPNAFETAKFRFDPEPRKRIRKALGLSDQFVMGNVARFNAQKNHGFLLSIFEKVAKQRQDAVLLLVGNGPKLEEIQKRIANHPYRERIIYYGITEKVEELYDAMVVFVLPTQYEGLGIVFIEAQISGLPVVTSNRVPQEVDVAGRTVMLSLDADPAVWCDAILGSTQIDRMEFYKEHRNEISAYDISQSIRKLERTYEALIENAGDRRS